MICTEFRPQSHHHTKFHTPSTWSIKRNDTHRATNFSHFTHHIISYHIISYHIISYHIISYHISYHIISYHISYHIISYHIISYHKSYHIITRFHVFEDIKQTSKPYFFNRAVIASISAGRTISVLVTLMTYKSNFKKALTTAHFLRLYWMYPYLYSFVS
jgi:hypothetical protein